MDLNYRDWEPRAWVMLVVGMVIAFFLGGSIYLAYLAWNLSTGRQAQILATVLGSLGTLLLAGATFYNVLQTNRSLELREKEREKPLVIDELSNLIQPSITSLENNLEHLNQSEEEGCAYDWVHIDGTSSYAGSKGPDPVRTPESLPLARLASDDGVLYSILRRHDEYVNSLADAADELHQDLKPEVERRLETEGIVKDSVDFKVVTSAVLKQVDDFDEGHSLKGFWERNRGPLIQYARAEPEVTIQDLKLEEEVYHEFVRYALEGLKQRKVELKQQYGISEDEIISEDDDELSVF